MYTRSVVILLAVMGVITITVWLSMRQTPDQREFTQGKQMWERFKAAYPLSLVTTMGDGATPAPGQSGSEGATADGAAALYIEAAVLLADLPGQHARMIQQPWQVEPLNLAEVERTHASALDLAHRAAALPHAHWPKPFYDPVNNRVPDYAPGLAQLTRLLVTQAKVRSDRGDMPGGVRSITALLDVAAHIGEDTSLVGTLTRFNDERRALDAIERLVVRGDADLSPLIDRLRQRDHPRALLRSCVVEADTYIELYESGRLASVDREGVRPFQIASYVRYGRKPHHDLLLLIEATVTLMDDWARPWDQQTIRQPMDVPAWANLTLMITQPLPEANQTAWMLQQRTALAIAALELMRFQQREGYYPLELSTVPDVPHDPTTGEPFTYYRQGDGFTLFARAAVVDDTAPRWDRDW